MLDGSMKGAYDAMVAGAAEAESVKLPDETPITYMTEEPAKEASAD